MCSIYLDKIMHVVFRVMYSWKRLKCCVAREEDAAVLQKEK